MDTTLPAPVTNSIGKCISPVPLCGPDGTSAKRNGRVFRWTDETKDFLELVLSFLFVADSQSRRCATSAALKISDAHPQATRNLIASRRVDYYWYFIFGKECLSPDRVMREMND
jgi:hypothetical protein